MPRASANAATTIGLDFSTPGLGIGGVIWVELAVFGV